MPPLIFAVAWFLMAAGYTFSGATKLVSPSWIDGTALQRVLESPLARPTFLREMMLSLPQALLRLLTWSLLAWEVATRILPHILQKTSILYYLQSMCPVPAPMESGAPALIQLLAAPADPASRPGAVLGLLLLTAFALWIAARAARRMQISYGAET